ncbi:MAG: hypothetical protein HFE60_12635 [Anaerotignum sp.]|jgi:ABC-type bacteriocin/lantibiotic exporter with double-glycine peptidase domain/uncharacterized Zn-finger protein|nr:hypothetical protein [Anaerotignum sp.]
MVKVKHIQQKNDNFHWKCGAVCLEMIFDYYSILCNQDEIWNAVKSNRSGAMGQYYALTHRLAEYAINHGLNATIYKANSQTWSTVLETLEQFSMPAILSITEKSSHQSHFVIFLGSERGKYIFSDPNSPKETVKWNYMEVKNMWSPNIAINVTGFIYILFEGDKISEHCQYCQKEFPLLIKNEIPFSENTICPYCDKQIQITLE